MFPKSIIENAYTALFELADISDLDDRFTRSNIFHLMRFIRAAIRDYPEKSDDLNAMFDNLSAYSARLKRLSDKKISRYVIGLSYTVKKDANKWNMTVPIPISNAHTSLILLVRNCLKEKSKGNYLRLYNIAELYVPKFLDYADWADVHIENDTVKAMISHFEDELHRYVIRLRKAMLDENINCNEFIV
ncbi:MAG: hypothetical protein NC253_12590 [Ruminococcus sp.]|nr:hypothetical protein [Ruminococcus sp.]MCM1479921.1 hypothetical protein [Muribaculaceae bacterium]